MASTDDAYETYFRSGDYDARYPRPNPHTLAVVLRAAPPGTTVIDIGAGNGRYAVALARLGRQVLAVERSESARLQLLNRAAATGLTDSIAVYASLDELAPAQVEAASAILLMFGVLAHMTYQERNETLSRLALMGSDAVRLIGSVPNRLRRFRREQVAAAVKDDGAAPRFTFKRFYGGQTVEMEYTAFSSREICAELEAANWNCLSLRPESVAPETYVTSNSLVGRADGVLSRILPGAAGHCMLYTATKNARVGAVL